MHVFSIAAVALFQFLIGLENSEMKEILQIKITNQIWHSKAFHPQKLLVFACEE